MFQSIEERAAEGAKFMDEARSGWYKEVDLETLHLGWGDCCILGQLFGDYEEGLIELNLTGPWSETTSRRLGFLVGGYNDTSLGYQKLTEAWKKEIKARLDQEELR